MSKARLAQLDRQLELVRGVRTALMGPGMTWLDQHTSRTALEAALAAVGAARRRIT